VLQCVAACCCALQCVASCHTALKCVAVCRSVSLTQHYRREKSNCSIETNKFAFFKLDLSTDSLHDAWRKFSDVSSRVNIATHCNTHCNTLQHTATHTATHCNTLQHTAAHCNTRRHTATHCNTLQQPSVLELLEVVHLVGS